MKGWQKNMIKISMKKSLVTEITTEDVFVSLQSKKTHKKILAKLREVEKIVGFKKNPFSSPSGESVPPQTRVAPSSIPISMSLFTFSY